MKFVLKTWNIFKNHPKKIILFGSLAGVGANFAKHKYEEGCLMRAYCEEALKYGEAAHSLTEEERHITVILNPAANNGKGKSKYEKYCAPLLHLSGMKVALVRTEHEGQAKQIMDVMDNTSAIVVAGGDGTLSEVLTGIFRREDSRSASHKFPLGILPLGETNNAASSIWLFSNVPEAKHLAEATMDIIRNLRRKFDIIEFTPMEDDEAISRKPVYAASLLEWGAFRDTKERKSLYWYWAFLKKYVVYVFSSYKDLTWNCAADVDYYPPCKGCSKCKINEQESKKAGQADLPRRWWQAFVPRSKNECKEEQIDYSTIINEECGKAKHLTLENISDVRIASKNTLSTAYISGHCLSLKTGKENISSTEFISEGWSREKGLNPSHEKEIICGEIHLKPKEIAKKDSKGADREMSIDSETFEVKAMKIRPMPEAVTVFGRPVMAGHR